VELKKKFKYRLILDESWSFGVLGSHGRGVTEYFGVTPSEIDMIIGSMATTLCAGGGFCAGSKEVVDHQVCPVSQRMATDVSVLLLYHMCLVLPCRPFSP
jgi:7-keto-8-aminopelargonate synthetase-like enzyme